MKPLKDPDNKNNKSIFIGVRLTVGESVLLDQIAEASKLTRSKTIRALIKKEAGK